VNKRIEEYVYDLFTDMPCEQYVQDVKEELLSNLNEKYDDLITEGKSDEEAYNLVIAGIGDIHELFRNGAQSVLSTPEDIEKRRNTKSVFVSLGVTLYILSLAVYFVLGEFGFEIMGIGAMILICAVATGPIVYGININKTRYVKSDDTFVEQYKEKVLEDERMTRIKRSISSSMWPLIVVFYLTISFVTQMWSVTWIIFLAGAFLQLLVLYLLAKPRKRMAFYYGMLWSVTTIVYFIISFAFGWWAWSWIIFLVALSFQEISRLISIWKQTGDQK